MHLTSKQIELLTVIAIGNGPSDPCDLDQILDRLKYETTKQSLQFSIRALIARGLILKLGPQKRRGRQRQVIEATALGRETIGISAIPKPHYVASISDDDLDQLMETTEAP
jgi:hypothetical protein